MSFGEESVRSIFRSGARRLAKAIAFFTAIPILFASSEMQTFTIAVHDVAGRPITRATARLLSLEHAFEVHAQADGHAEFNGVLPGIYDVEVSAAGFSMRRYPATPISSRDSKLLGVVLDRVNHVPDHCGFLNTLNYAAIASEAERLSGRVIDQDNNKGIRDVKIELVDAAAGTSITWTLSGPNGYFAFPDLPAGRYRLRASRNDYEPTGMDQFLVPRDSLTTLHIGLDKRGHMHVCQ
jgi:hypothetical protein